MSGNSTQAGPGLPDDYRPPLPFQPVIVFPPYVPRPPASGTRTAAGLFSMALALVELVHFFPTWFVALATGSTGFAILAALYLVSSLGNISLGVSMLAGRRGRRRAVPFLAAGFTGLAILLCLADVGSVSYSPDILIPSLAGTLVTAAAVLVLLWRSRHALSADMGG